MHGGCPASFQVPSCFDTRLGKDDTRADEKRPDPGYTTQTANRRPPDNRKKNREDPHARTKRAGETPALRKPRPALDLN